MLKLASDKTLICSPGLLNLVQSLDDNIAAAVRANLHETAALLHMAKLDLLTRIHNITEEEMEHFLFVAKSCVAAARAAVDQQEPDGMHR